MSKKLLKKSRMSFWMCFQMDLSTPVFRPSGPGALVKLVEKRASYISLMLKACTMAFLSSSSNAVRRPELSKNILGVDLLPKKDL